MNNTSQITKSISSNQIAKDRPYVPQVDGIRGIAIVLILIWHYTRISPLFWRLGVGLFFVLSSFLVTRSLLQWRQEGMAPAKTLIAFYVRRHGRLVPVLYVTLILALIADLPDVKQTFVWAASYLLNYYMVEHGYPDTVAHLWYLAAQEQIYLLLPALVICLSHRRTKLVALLCCVVGPICRYFGFPYEVPLVHLDAVGGGMFLALGFRAGGILLSWWIGISLVALAIANQMYVGWYAVDGILMATWAVWLLLVGMEIAPHRRLGRLLGAYPLVWLGRISYSLFLVHAILIFPTLEVANIVQIPISNYPAIYIVVLTFEAIGLGWLLWRFIELPSGRLARAVVMSNFRS